MFKKYENYLNGVTEEDNFWSDIGISEAVKILEKFSEYDWQMLEETIQSKPNLWFVSCAETLGDNVGGVRSFELLMKLLSSESNEVKIDALDSINSRISLGFDFGEGSEQIRAAIEAIRGSAGIVVRKVLDSLENRIP